MIKTTGQWQSEVRGGGSGALGFGLVVVAEPNSGSSVTSCALEWVRFDVQI